MSVIREHLPLVIITVLLAVAMIILYKDIGSLRASVGVVSGKVAKISSDMAQPVAQPLTFEEYEDGDVEEEEQPPAKTALTGPRQQTQQNVKASS